MALSDAFLAPLGLAALAAAVPLVLLYLIRPDPKTVELPTLRFLEEDRGQDTTRPFMERLERNMLLLLQILAIALFALALASPYVLVSEARTVEETVLVVDGSASMGTQVDDTTRFARAVSAAEDATTGTTSVIFAGPESEVLLRQSGPDGAERALSNLAATDAEGDLRSAVESAASIAGENAQIVVFSDFADDGAWGEAVRTARARGLRVELRQFDGGGEDNVGIVDRTFSGGNVTVSVKNFGEEAATRTLTAGERTESISLESGDVTTATFPAPPGGAEVRLTPGDSFPTDDVLYVSAPRDAEVDVLLLTNDRNQYLATALSVMSEVNLTVDAPPTSVRDGYDVIIYSNVDPESLLESNVEAGADVVEGGGGVAVQASENMPAEKYGNLLLIEPSGIEPTPTIGSVADDSLTRGISFSSPERYVAGSLAFGRPLVATAQGPPLIASAERAGGRLLYYGYIERDSSFKYNYQYPVFWKRAVFYLAGRDSLSALNYPTGERFRFGEETAVETPDGSVTTTSITLDRAGFYELNDRRIGASLLSGGESDVVAADLDATNGGSGGVPAREEDRQVPRPLTEWAALGALALTLCELGFLRHRGDL